MKYLNRENNEIVSVLQIENGKVYLSNGQIVSEKTINSSPNYIKTTSSSFNTNNDDFKIKTNKSVMSDNSFNLDLDALNANRYSKLTNRTQVGRDSDDIQYTNIDLDGNNRNIPAFFSGGGNIMSDVASSDELIARARERERERIKQNGLISKYSDDEEQLYGNSTSNSRTVASSQPQRSPIYDMFKKAKRRLEFTYSLNQTSILPRVDFIEMMEDSYDESIVDFLADEIFENIMNNKKLIIHDIKRQIYDILPNLEMEEEDEVIHVENNNDIKNIDKSIITKELSDNDKEIKKIMFELEHIDKNEVDIQIESDISYDYDEDTDFLTEEEI